MWEWSCDNAQLAFASTTDEPAGSLAFRVPPHPTLYTFAFLASAVRRVTDSLRDSAYRRELNVLLGAPVPYRPSTSTRSARRLARDCLRRRACGSPRRSWELEKVRPRLPRMLTLSAC